MGRGEAEARRGEAAPRGGDQAVQGGGGQAARRGGEEAAARGGGRLVRAFISLAREAWAAFLSVAVYRAHEGEEWKEEELRWQLEEEERLRDEEDRRRQVSYGILVMAY